MITWHKDDNQIIRVVLFSKHKSKPVIAGDFISDFKRVVDEIVSESNAKGIIISSKGKDFCLGFLPSYLLGFSDVEMMRSVFFELQQSLRKLETLPLPVVAIINGKAEGFGLELALACQRRMASKDSHTGMGFTEINKGVIPALGGIQRAARLLGHHKGAQLLLEGRLLSSQQAFEVGLVDEIGDSRGLETAAMSWLEDLVEHEVGQPWDRADFSYPGGGMECPKNQMGFMASNALLRKKTFGNYPAYQAITSALYEGGNLTFNRALDVDLDYFLKNQMAKETQEILMTLGVHRNAVLYEAEQIAKDSKPVKSMAVIGSGLMGAGIAEVAAKSGIKVFLFDQDRAHAEVGRDRAAANLKAFHEKNLMTVEEYQLASDNLTIGKDFNEIAQVDLVIEAVIEDLAVKNQVFQQIVPHLSKTTLVASNTSKLSIQRLAKQAGLQDRFVGLHFFSPVAKMPLVELIKTPSLKHQHLNRAQAFVHSINKIAITVNDRYGFFTTRVIESYLVEGLALLADGVKPALIENAARLAGMPVGPLALCDEVGLDVLHNVSINNAEFGEHPMLENAARVLEFMVVKYKRQGRKNQKGFYDYPKDGPKMLWGELALTCPQSALQPDVETVQDKLIFIQAIEAEKAYQEGVIENRADGDLASILGIGFPAFTGGVFAYQDYLGEAQFQAKAKQLANAVGERFHLNL